MWLNVHFTLANKNKPSNYLKEYLQNDNQVNFPLKRITRFVIWITFIEIFRNETTFTGIEDKIH